MKKINQYEPKFGSAEAKALFDYINKQEGWLTEFQKTEELEKEICKLTGAKYASVVTNGTVALFLALKAAGVKAGDEVIVPNITMVATPNAAAFLGAKPIFVDVKEDLCLDAEKLVKAITRKTKAVMFVDFNGRTGDLLKVKKICQQKKIPLIEDAAQAFASTYRKKYLGTFGDYGIYSLSFHKIITTGQGGVIVTNNKENYEKIEKFKDFGRLSGGKDWHEAWGWNFKFTDLQAIFGLEQIKEIKWRVKKKREIFKLYQKLLKDVPEVRFIKTDLTEVTPWFVDIFVDSQKELSEYLAEKNIGTRAVYPPLNSQPIYKGSKGKFPVSAKLSAQGLWLPSSLNLTNQEIKIVAKEIKAFYA